jgi:hypothetical protein
MRKDVLLALGSFAFVVFVLGGAVWLANAPLQPKPQTAHAVLPDERISR